MGVGQLSRIFFSFLLFIALAGVGFAHEDTEAEGYNFELHAEPELIIENEPVTLTITITDAEGNPVPEDEPRVVILREDIPVTKAGPSAYQVEYTFARFGANELDFFYGEKHATWNDINVVVGANNPPYGLIALALTVLTIAGFTAAVASKKMKKGSAAQYGVIALVVVGLGYSVSAFYASPANEGCMLKIGNEFVLHCHQNIHINLCGDDKAFAWEAGDLDSAHTHKGDHRIHWHPGAPVEDPAALMTLRNLFSDFGHVLTETSVEDPETGKLYVVGKDSCGAGTGGTLTVYSTPENSNERIEMADFMNEMLEDEARIDIEYR